MIRLRGYLIAFHIFALYPALAPSFTPVLHVQKGQVVKAQKRTRSASAASRPLYEILASFETYKQLMPGLPTFRIVQCIRSLLGDVFVSQRYFNILLQRVEDVLKCLGSFRNVSNHFEHLLFTPHHDTLPEVQPC